MPAAPSAWVVRFLNGLRPGERVLDLACGSGRHLALGLERGLRMVGLDRDIAPARRLVPHPNLELFEHDLEDGRPFPFPALAFDGIIVTNYLWRPILPDIVAAIAEDGVLIYETFAVGNGRYGRPSNPEFLLRPGELLAVVQPALRVIAFEHAKLDHPERIVQRICAVGRKHRWPVEDVPWCR